MTAVLAVLVTTAAACLLVLHRTGAEQVAPLPQVECPEKEGVQTYPHPELCDQFYLCSNGTLTLERCQNGLLFKGGHGAAHHHCHYHWDVDCGSRAVELIPLSSDGCEYQFGLYTDAAGACSGKYTRCEFGRPQLVDCPPGLAFDVTIHRCQWADQLEHIGCTAEQVTGFKCPSGIPSDPVSARFWPYPRFAIEGDCEKLISCVNGHPRVISCGEDLVVDDSTLTCEEPELVPNCGCVLPVFKVVSSFFQSLRAAKEEEKR
ncbi:Protein obstructor-E [Frankliniella fusca]|uniref:Protein obstructor-E n=1 Tax=Frankliniella fusca TaxID=407009 RepID=A0AAE1HVE7_9NEOP|nr:Protein obstructor-E [Frankliniella fusca]